MAIQTCTLCHRQEDSTKMFQCSGNTYECIDENTCRGIAAKERAAILKIKEDKAAKELYDKLKDNYYFLTTPGIKTNEKDMMADIYGEIKKLNIDLDDLVLSESQFRDAKTRYRRIGVTDKNEKFIWEMSSKKWDIIISKSYFKEKEELHDKLKNDYDFLTTPGIDARGMNEDIYGEINKLNIDLDDLIPYESQFRDATIRYHREGVTDKNEKFIWNKVSKKWNIIISKSYFKIKEENGKQLTTSQHDENKLEEGITFIVNKDILPQAYRYNAYVSKNGDYVSSLKEFKKENCSRVLQSTTFPEKTKVSVESNGFVHSITNAYNYHQNIQLRPDDVWIAIMTQFSLYVEANSEELRDIFVSHVGEKEIVVSQTAILDSADYGQLASDMALELEKHIKDPALREWIIPAFTTTDNNDKIVGSVIMMATLKKYFGYGFQLCCGLPEVTLLGTPEDWKEICDRAEKLRNYGKTCSSWVELLAPVLLEFYKTSKGEYDVDFWNKVCHYSGGGSGPTFLSGWITAFCVFGDKGEWQGEKGSIQKMVLQEGQDENKRSSYVAETIKLDYPKIDTDDIPPGYVTVPIKIDDNGKEHKSIMFAGHMLSERLDVKSLAPKLSWAIVLQEGDGDDDDIDSDKDSDFYFHDSGDECDFTEPEE